MIHISKLEVSKKAEEDDIWLAPYVGYTVWRISDDSGESQYIFDGDINPQMEDYEEYFIEI